jgi:hypothetical protein
MANKPKKLVAILFGVLLVGGILLGGSGLRWGPQQVSAGDKDAGKKEKDPNEGKKGKTIGMLVAKTENAIEVKADGEEKARRYVPQWVGGVPASGGGFDKAILKTIKELKVGSRIEVDWVFQERFRALTIKLLHAPVEKDSSDKVTKGRTIGVLVTKGDKFLEVRGDGEEKPRKYHAKWLAGPPAGFDKEMLKGFQELAIGSRVLLEWISTNHGPQVQSFQVLKAAEKK